MNLKQGNMSIDEYQQKFFEFLPHCTYISNSSKGKYDLFLQGLNSDIYGQVAINDDPTSYEVLVKHFHNAENTLKRNKNFSSSFQLGNSLGPRALYLKKPGASYSSRSGSGLGSGRGVFHFGKKKRQCHQKCGGHHTTYICRRENGACFRCGQMGQMNRDFPQMIGGSASGSCAQASVPQKPLGQSVGSTNQKPRILGQVFALSQDQVQKENEEVIAGTFFLFGIPAFVFIDTGALHLFISACFVKRHRLPYISLDEVLSVSTPIGQSALAKSLVLGCTLEFEGSGLVANLMILVMEDFDCILGIDVLTSYRTTVDCYQRVVQFCLVKGDSWFFYGEEA
ncbi:uncharacterized protein [Henckelia pumila]|uniref:uncharacterized protein n=1 Tax=Henckelia pumila TaxID=405737 RepID=UPI003C6E22A3